MKSSEYELVTVTILGREYRLRCQSDERDSLIAASRYLDKEMRNIRDSGNILGLERIAIMAALNVSHELYLARTKQSDTQTHLVQQILRIDEKVDHALAMAKNPDAS